jgi:GntR family transcriptional regulator
VPGKRVTAKHMTHLGSRSTTRIVDGPTPKHTQLREILRELVEQGLPAGSPIPSERELAVAYGVSRLTVRSAVGRLVDEGLLSRVAGKGTFTVRRRLELQQYLTSFSDDMHRRGRTPATEVVTATEGIPPSSSASALGLQPGEPAFHLVRLRRADGVGMAVERGWYNARRLPGLLGHDLTRSLYRLFGDAYGIQLDHATQTVWAQAADRLTARMLDVPGGSALLAFRRVSTADGQPIEDTTSWYRGDLYQVTMHVDRNVPDPGPDPVKGGSR